MVVQNTRMVFINEIVDRVREKLSFVWAPVSCLVLVENFLFSFQNYSQGLDCYITNRCKIALVGTLFFPSIGSTIYTWGSL